MFAAAADINGDGKLDVVAVNSSNHVSVALGNGDGTFQPAVNYQVGEMPSAVAIADFDGDGTLDLAVSNLSLNAAGSLSFLAGKGDGTFRPAVTVDAGTFPSSTITGDFNSDGRTDLVLINGYLSPALVLLSTGH